MQRGGTRQALTFDMIADFEIPLPPLPEQRRIAAILDKADAIRRKREEGIGLTEELLRSTFLDMFGDPVANPKSIPTCTLGDLSEDMTYGTSQKCESERNGAALPVLRIPNILHGRVDWADIKYAILPPKDVRQLTLMPDDILFVRTNGNPEYIGRCAIYSAASPCLFASYLIRVRLPQSAPYRPRFLQQIVTMPTYRSLLVAEARTTAGNYNISTQGLRRLRLIAPGLDAQDRFLKTADKIAGVLGRREQSTKKSSLLFDALVQRAFRGELGLEGRP